MTCNEIKSEGWCDEMCGLCDAIDKSDTTPEPEQDDRKKETIEILNDLAERTKNGEFDERFEEERFREAFEKEFAIPEELFWDEKGGYLTNTEFTLMSEMNHTYIGFKSGCTSRNVEIEDLKTRLMASEGAVKMLNEMDDENQKTIQSLRCCGNCDNIRATPQDHDFCWKNNGNLPSERICKDWERKPK